MDLTRHRFQIVTRGRRSRGRRPLVAHLVVDRLHDHIFPQGFLAVHALHARSAAVESTQRRSPWPSATAGFRARSIARVTLAVARDRHLEKVGHDPGHHAGLQIGERSFQGRDAGAQDRGALHQLQPDRWHETVPRALERRRVEIRFQ